MTGEREGRGAVDMRIRPQPIRRLVGHGDETDNEHAIGRTKVNEKLALTLKTEEFQD